MEDNKVVRNRLNVYVPFSIMEVIKRIEEHRIGDGRTNTSKQSIALELMDIGARIEKKKLDAMERGESLYQNKLEDQLSFIAHNIIRTNQKFDRFFKVFVESQGIDKQLIMEVIERTPLKEKEVNFLKTLFSALEGYDYD